MSTNVVLFKTQFQPWPQYLIRIYFLNYNSNKLYYYLLKIKGLHKEDYINGVEFVREKQLHEFF